MANYTIGLRVCGQCGDPTFDEEYSCLADPGCDLVLCGACSYPEVHFDDDGSCQDWWGKSMTEQERVERMQEAYKIYSESMT